MTDKIRLIAKTNRAKNKLAHHGDLVEIQTLRVDEATDMPITLGMFKGEPALLVKHDTGNIRWVQINCKDPEFEVDLDPFGEE